MSISIDKEDYYISIPTHFILFGLPLNTFDKLQKRKKEELNSGFLKLYFKESFGKLNTAESIKNAIEFVFGYNKSREEF